MRRLLVPLALLVAIAIVAGGLGLVLRSRDADGGVDSRSRSSLSVVGVATRPPVHAFGEPVVAEVVLVGNGDLLRPESVRMNPDFAPYERTGPARVERSGSGSNLRWRFRYPLSCLREGCAPDGPRRTFEFPLTNVVYRFRDSPGPASTLIDWPPFEVTGRVSNDAVSRRTWRADVTSLPEVSYRLAPGVLAAGLLAGSAALAALAVWIVWWFARRRDSRDRETAEHVDVSPVPPLERALELAGRASRNGDAPERRKALERVARELGARGLTGLADRARTLAWAPGPASPAAVEELARDARAAAVAAP